ncbi:hypothetical protein OSB04_026594 [Centaurea solstitialis]|uniref:Uncharacterized protein n=1 Tax=Centaurea solstitialis TaxID=347529 RepID=A0AA38SCZ9_9ASTR|nr:hypothetical protein OSB04_026594 [Centaurea solstitialis]
MKPSLFIVSFILFISIALAAEVTIKDAKGKKVLNNVPYHLGPANAAKGGGLKLTNMANNKKICPYNVVQDPSTAIGGKFTFTHTYKRPKYLHTEGNLGIGSGFPKTGPCLKSTFWTITDADAKAPDNLVTTGGGFDDGTTCFQLVEYPKPTNPKVPSYMLQHCPYYCGGTPTTSLCYNPSLFIVSFIFFIGIALAAQVTIKDAKGKKVLNNVPYHLGPATAAKGGGFKLSKTANNKKICPYNVVQDPSAANLGDAFTFTHNYKRPKYLHTEGVVGIDSGFPKTGPCLKSTFWTVPDVEGKTPDNLVTTGGGFEEDTTCFQLVEYPKPTNPKVPSYMLQQCPYYCGGTPTPVMCYNISIYVDKGLRRLASGVGTPFEFVFHKVPNNNLEVRWHHEKQAVANCWIVVKSFLSHIGGNSKKLEVEAEMTEVQHHDRFISNDENP